MMKFTITKHCAEDRLERLTRIGMTVGFGEKVLLEYYNEKTNHVERLMDNGLLLILDAYGEILITAYLIDIDRAFAMYSAQGIDLPKSIAKMFVSKAYKRLRDSIK